MANKNFVVQNGLTVGGATIFASNSDIRTSGNITITGSGTINVPSFGVSSISMNDSSVAINDTGPSGSTIEFTLDNAVAGNVSASGMNIPTGTAYRINQTDVLSATTLKSGVINSSLTSVGTLQNLTVSGNTAINNTLYGRGVYDNSNRVVSTSSGAGNLTISGASINLNSIGPGAITVGSSTSIPVITTDAYGRVVALTSSSVSTTINLAGTSGTGSVAGGGTLTFSGSHGVTASASSSTITIDTPQDLQTTASPTFTGLTTSANTIVNSTLYARGVYDSSNRVVSTSSGAGNLSISGTAIALPATGPGAASVGSSTAIPVITTDAYGRVASTSTAAVVAPAGTLSGDTLASGVVHSSLTDVGTLTALTVSGTTKPNANATVALGATNAYWTNFYAVSSNFNQATVGGQGISSAGIVTITNNSESTSAASGALQVTGGVGIGANLYVSGTSTLKGNVTIGGNLTVSGSSVSIGTSDLAIQDPIINLHTFANLAPLTSNDGSDIGLKFHYYDSADSAAFIGRAADTGYLEWYAKGSDTANIFTGTYYGTIKSGAIWLANTTTSTSTTTGALRVDGGAGVAGNVYSGGVGYFGSTSSVALTNPLIVATGSANNFTQVQIQNTNSGGSASGDIVITTDNGTDSANFIDVGINSSGYNDVNFTVQKALDGYAYVNGGNLTVGTQSSGKNIVFHTGGTLAAQARAMISDIAFTANGINILPSANVTQNLGSSTAYWGTTYTGQLTANAITVGGNVTVTGNIMPGANVTYNLGSSEFRWKDLFLSGSTINLGGTTISAPIGGALAVNTGNIVAGGGTASSSTTTGALVVVGGVGISGSINTGGSITPSANVTQNLGSATAYWGTTFTGQVTANTVVANAGTGNAAVYTGNVYHAGNIIPFTSNAFYNLGTSTSWWNTFYGVSTQAKYADLAENYQADAIYEPGTVLMFGGENEVTVADPDTTAVAGVVSTNPAHLMNGALQGAKVVALALQGRVPCKVIGPVTKGDILVSAGFGFAKTAPDRQLGMRFGQVIGKALENVAPGIKATIEVVVGRV
jgi:hypothetical protein